MGSLILRSRVEMARRNLDVVIHALEAIEQRRVAIGSLLELEVVTRNESTRLQTGLTSIESDDTTLQDRGWNDLYDASRNLAREVAKVAEHVDAIRLRSAIFDEGGRPKWLQSTIQEAIGTQVADLDEILTSIIPGNAGSQTALSKGWKSYLEALHSKSERAFAEYVDLLGGFALRDAGFDDGICNLADSLVRSYVPGGDFNWNSLTVPARREALSMTMARIIRLGFPEWSVWAVPLAAHEFGHVRVGNDKSLAHLATWAPSDMRAADAQILVADAYATRIMGPAYASAALLMRLDPWHAYDGDGDLIAMRAAVILGMLTPPQDAQVDPFKKTTTQLADEWRDALAQCGVAGTLSTAQTDQIDGLITLVRNTIKPPWSLETTTWDTIVGWSKHLVAGAPDLVDTTEIEEQPLRYLLNAAWLARLAAPGQTKVDAIAKATLAVWRRLEDLRRRALEEASGTGRSRGRRGGGRQQIPAGSAAAQNIEKPNDY